MATVEYTVVQDSVHDGADAELVRDFLHDEFNEWYDVDQVEPSDFFDMVGGENGSYEITGTATVTGAPKLPPAFMRR